MKLIDMHTHSSFSVDSNEDLRNYFIEAKKLGVDFVCTCEHIDFETVFNKTDWLVDFDKLINYQKELEKEYNIKALLGVEIGYKYKYLDKINSIISKYPFDVVLLSIHDNNEFDYYFENAFSKGITSSLNDFFELTLSALDNFYNFDSLSHIDFGFKTAKMIDNSIDISYFENYLIKIFEKLIKLNKALEINSKTNDVINSINKDYSHTNYILNLYKKCNGKLITLSSDAHSSDKYRSNFDIYIDLIKKNGFNSINYFIKRVPLNCNI